MLLYIPQVSFAVPFVTEETEIAMGKNADPQVIQLYGIYQDKKLQLYVNEIGQKLVDSLSDKIFPRFHFKLVDSPEINAFALPGGYVYVTRGLLAALNSEAELANVLGHEIAHVTLHHGAKMMVRNIAAQILSIGGAIASPKNAGEWLLVSTAMFQQINMGYGRGAELEADAQGMLTATKTGYNPKSMVNFLRNLRRHEIMSGLAYHSFQSSHPDTRDRIVKSDGLGESLLYRNPKVAEKREEYLTRLQGMVFGGKRHSQDTKPYEPEYVQIYQVQPGDTFQSIAENELGDARKDLDISVLNGRKESSQPVPGELIKIIQKGVYKKNKSLRLQPEKNN